MRWLSTVPAEMQQDQPKGHSARQQQELEEPSPPHVDWPRTRKPTEVQLAATETLTPAEARMEPTGAHLVATETLATSEARMEPTEVQLAATESLVPAEVPRQAQECSQRTQQPQHQRDQPKGHSVRQQQELEEPSPPHMDWSRSQGEEDMMHNSQRATPPDKTAAGVRALLLTEAVRRRRKTGQLAEVAEALIPSPAGEDLPAARNGRPTTSGMSAGATAATADKDEPEALCREGFYSCPAIISRRPGSQDISKESQLNPEEDSRIKQARSHVTLEKSS